MSKIATGYLVYAAKYDNNIVYVGSGANGREKHCTTGCSHSYGLNKLHFENKQVEVVILHRLNDKKESLYLETALIAKYKPIFNVVNTPVKSKCEVYEKWHDYLLKNTEPRKYIECTKVILSLINYFGIEKITTGKGVRLKDIENDPRFPASSFIYCKKIKHKGTLLYSYYVELYDVLCSVEGFIKLPTTPTLIKVIDNDTTN